MSMLNNLFCRPTERSFRDIREWSDSRSSAAAQAETETLPKEGIAAADHSLSGRKHTDENVMATHMVEIQG